MYSLFSHPPRKLGGQIVVPRFKDVSARITHDVQKVVDYYQTGTFFTRTDHLLVRLISAMDVPLSYEVDRYYEVATARALAVANSLRLTSAINVGQWFSGIFYYNCPELIIAYTGEDNPNELLKGWRQLQAVKVLECPVSNLNYLIPDGKPNQIEEGLAVIAIDIPMLMVQFLGFVMEQRYRIAQGDTAPVGIRHFVGRYVLPNMLYQQTDLVIHNRLFNLQSGAPMGDARRRHPFFVSDYTELLDRGLQEVLDRVSTLRMRYRDLLEAVPKVFNDYPLRMPDIAETRQCWWALFLTRLKAIQFLFDVAGEEGRHYNQTELNSLKIDLRRFQSENIFKSVLSEDMYIDVNYQLKTMLAKL